MKMQTRYFLLIFGVCEATILKSKNLKVQISEEFFTPHDLVKADLVDKSWINLENVYGTISANRVGGLFQHMKKNEVNFQAKEYCWKDVELIEEFSSSRSGLTENDILERNWQKMFMGLVSQFRSLEMNKVIHDFLEFLAEIINVEEVYGPYAGKPLHFLAELGDVALIKSLLNRKAQIDTTAFHPIGNIQHESPLLRAVRSGKFEAAKTLLEHGASPNFKDEYGTSLFTAATFNQPRLIPLLLKYGAEINATVNTRRTPLINAMRWSVVTQRSYCDVVEALVANGANPILRDVDGNTAVSYAKTSGCTKCSLLLMFAIVGRCAKSKHFYLLSQKY